MYRFAKITIGIVLILCLPAACGNSKDISPFEEILSQPPYASLTDSIGHDKKNADLYFRRAVLLNSNDLTEPALADFRKAWSLEKKEPFALGIGGLLQEKNADSAILFLNEALQVLPGSLLLRLNLAHAYAALNKTDLALQLCDSILAREPQRVDVMKLKADLLDKKGDKGQLISVLEQAYKLAPFDVELNYMLALRYSESRNPKLLILCDSLIRADSLDQHAEPYYYKGLYYSNINDRQRALEAFDEAIRHDYTFLDSYVEKSAVLYDQKKYGEAIKVLNLALNVSPSFADAYYWLGKCQEALGHKEEARLNYQKAYGLDQTLTEAKQGADRLN